MGKEPTSQRASRAAVVLVAVGLARATALAAPTEPLYWVSGSGADEGEVYCGPCASWMARHLRRHPHDPKADRARPVGGEGWGLSEEDGARWCGGCGVRLQVSLTNWGVETELDGVDGYADSDAANTLLELINNAVDEQRDRVAVALARFALGGTS